MILASAIKYYIEETEKEVILCGARHGDVFTQLEALGFEPRKGELCGTDLKKEIQKEYVE